MSTIRYQLSEQEVAAVLLKHRRFPYRLVAMRVCAGLAGLGLILYSENSASKTDLLLVIGTFLVLYSAAMLIWLPIYRRQAVSEIVQGDPLRTAPVTLTFQPEGLLVVLPNLKAELA